MGIFKLSNLNTPDDPSEIAEKVAKKFLKKGYCLDFSIASLENEIDSILKNESQWSYRQKERLETELTAYFGETICRIFNAKWKGKYFKDFRRSGINYYSCSIQKNTFEFSPSHFFGYYFENGSKRKNPFKDYLHLTYYSKEDDAYVSLLNKIIEASN